MTSRAERERYQVGEGRRRGTWNRPIEWIRPVTEGDLHRRALARMVKMAGRLRRIQRCQRERAVARPRDTAVVPDVATTIAHINAAATTTAFLSHLAHAALLHRCPVNALMSPPHWRPSRPPSRRRRRGDVAGSKWRDRGDGNLVTGVTAAARVSVVAMPGRWCFSMARATTTRCARRATFARSLAARCQEPHLLERRTRHPRAARAGARDEVPGRRHRRAARPPSSWTAAHVRLPLDDPGRRSAAAKRSLRANVPPGGASDDCVPGTAFDTATPRALPLDETHASTTVHSWCW